MNKRTKWINEFGEEIPDDFSDIDVGSITGNEIRESENLFIPKFDEYLIEGQTQIKFPIDDYSEFLPRGYRRSEEWIANREKQENWERFEKEKRNSNIVQYQEVNNDNPNNDNSNDNDVKNNGNTSQSYPPTYLQELIFPVVSVILFLLGMYIISHL